MDQLQMVIDALRNSGANGGMVGQAAQALQARPGQIEAAIQQPQAAPAPQMQNVSAAPNAQGLTPFQLYQLQQARQGMGGQ